MAFTWLSEDEIAEFLTKTERKKSQNTQNILLNACYLLFEEYLHKKNLYLYLKTVPKNKPKFRRRNMDEPKLEVGNITRCK